MQTVKVPMTETNIRVLIPALFREIFPNNPACLLAADNCEKEGTADAAAAAARAAADVADAAYDVAAFDAAYDAAAYAGAAARAARAAI